MKWAAHEVRLERTLEFPVASPMFDAMLMPLRHWKNTVIYNEFLMKIDRPWILSFWLAKGRRQASMFTIHGGSGRGPFTSGDGERLKRLVPHLQRAFAIRGTLQRTVGLADRLSEAIDRLPFGVIYLDKRGVILECSAVASALMTGSSGLQSAPDGTLNLRGQANALLKRWMLGGAPPLDNPHGLLKVTGPAGTPLSVLATPLSPGMETLAGFDARWMVLVFDPAKTRRVHVALISHDLGISLREAELVAHLCRGRGVDEIAATMGISPHTARTHLKAVFAKSGCGSQVEVMRRVFAGPAGVALD